jgi:hypothetical protein
VKTFFLIASLVVGATFTAGSAEAAKVMWVALVVVGLVLLWFRKPRHVEKASVPTEYSEVEIREILTALTVAKSTAPFRKIPASRTSTDDRYEELG